MEYEQLIEVDANSDVPRHLLIEALLHRSLPLITFDSSLPPLPLSLSLSFEFFFHISLIFSAFIYQKWILFGLTLFSLPSFLPSD